MGCKCGGMQVWSGGVQVGMWKGTGVKVGVWKCTVWRWECGRV